MNRFILKVMVDHDWGKSMRKSWKRRKYWIQKEPIRAKDGKILSVRILDTTFRVQLMNTRGKHG